MNMTFDTETKTATLDGRVVDLYGAESFDALADLWVRIGWVRKYSYAFSWMGRPIIQLPDDMVRIQEVIYATKPDVIIETGVAHGGSLVYYASISEALNHGRVIGVDVLIRPENRAAIEAHPMKKRISLVEGNSVDEQTLARVRGLIQPQDRVMVILDSNHSKAHVAAELHAYADFVTKDCFLLVQDGVMKLVAGMPRTDPDWDWNNPCSAINEFLAARTDFIRHKLARPFNESSNVPDCSHHPEGWLLRV